MSLDSASMKLIRGKKVSTMLSMRPYAIQSEQNHVNIYCDIERSKRTHGKKCCALCRTAVSDLEPCWYA